MKAYREIDSSKRTPPERTEVHVINNGLLTSGFIQDGQWYLGEHETAVLKFDGVWLEEYASQSGPNTVTEDSINTFIEESVSKDNTYVTQVALRHYMELAIKWALQQTQATPTNTVTEEEIDNAADEYMESSATLRDILPRRVFKLGAKWVLQQTQAVGVREPFNKEAIELVKKYIPNDALAKEYILELLNQKK